MRSFSLPLDIILYPKKDRRKGSLAKGTSFITKKYYVNKSVYFEILSVLFVLEFSHDKSTFSLSDEHFTN